MRGGQRRFAVEDETFSEDQRSSAAFQEQLCEVHPCIYQRPNVTVLILDIR